MHEAATESRSEEAEPLLGEGDRKSATSDLKAHILQIRRVGASDEIRAAHDSDVFQISDYINANASWYLFVTSLVEVIIQIAAVMGSHFIVVTQFHNLPHCYNVGGETQYAICTILSVMHCTFPMVCIGIALVVFAKNMHDSRLYYECLLNGIMLDFDNQRRFVGSWAFYVIGIYGSAACCVTFYSASYLPSLTFVFYLNMAYLSPILAFVFVLVSKWQIESGLIPLPKFCEIDHEVATSLLGGSVFVSEALCRIAFFRTEFVLDSEGSQPLPSEEYFALLRKHCKEEMDSFIQKRRLSELGADCPWYEKLLGKYIGIRPAMTYSERYSLDLSEEAVEAAYATVSKGTGYRLPLFHWGVLPLIFWTAGLLYSKHLSDPRSQTFRRWSLAYYIFAAIVGYFLVEMILNMTITVLWYNHVLDVDTAWLRNHKLVDEEMMNSATGNHSSAFWHDMSSKIHAYLNRTEHPSFFGHT